MTTHTSYGQQLTRRYLEFITNEPFIENYRPDWLFGMEIDFFFPESRVAIEFNGDQHVCWTDFGGDPKRQKARDWRKDRLCIQRGVHFVKFEAIDLIYHVFIRKLKDRLKWIQRGNRKCYIDKLATAYRKSLIAKYDSPTARARKKGPRKEALSKRNTTQAPAS